MERHGMLIGEVAAQSGVSRKALRIYEAAGILSPPARTAAGYRVYGTDALERLAFVGQARRLGLSLGEIREIVLIRRSGRVPCRHVQELVERRAAEVDRQLEALAAMRERLGGILASWRGRRRGRAAVCPHIEQPVRAKPGRTIR